MPDSTIEPRRSAHSAATQKAENMPERIQRKRVKGWRMPAGAVYVGRGSKWGNPYVVQIAPKGMVGAYPMTDMRYAVVDTRDNAPRGNYKLFPTFHDAARYASGQYIGHFFAVGLHNAAGELAGHDLACWCAPGAACHADFLLREANRKELTA